MVLGGNDWTETPGWQGWKHPGLAAVSVHFK